MIFYGDAANAPNRGVVFALKPTLRQTVSMRHSAVRVTA
jgi:hypothetical protein